MLDASYEQLIQMWLQDRVEFRKAIIELFQQGVERKCSKSYVHENGFAKITLQESNDRNAALRIHIWSGVQSESNVHTHCFNLTSTVLLGAVRDRVYIEDSNGIEFNKFLYSRRGTREKYSLLPRGVSKLSVFETKVRNAGTRYTHKFDTLHTSQAISGEVVTLFIADRRGAPDTALVYTNRYSLEGEDVLSPALNQDRVIEILSQIG